MRTWVCINVWLSRAYISLFFYLLITWLHLENRICLYNFNFRSNKIYCYTIASYSSVGFFVFYRNSSFWLAFLETDKQKDYNLINFVTDSLKGKLVKIKKEILTVMHETLPGYRMLQVGAKLVKCFRGHLRTPNAISCIGYVLLSDWPSHLREQINRTFQFRNCHGKLFCSFWCIHGNNPRAVSVWESDYTQKSLFQWANATYPWVKGLV